MVRSAGRTGRPWLRAAANLRAKQLPCWLCGKAIDYLAMPRTPRSFSVDHVIPLSRGGAKTDPRNLRAAHYGCNSRRGDGKRKSKTPRPLRTSRNW